MGLRSESGHVVSKVEGKCKTILEEVKTDKSSQKSPLFEQAELLRDDGTRLLQAASKAKQAVEDEVTKALKSVVRMDDDLKKDLRSVKEKIKGGIESVIDNLEVMKLGENVKSDLGELKRRIEELNQNDKLVTDKLKALSNEKTTKLDTVVNRIKDETDKKLVDNFNKHIKAPLNEKVSAVDTAIGKLGGKFTKDEGSEAPKDFNGIFGHIKDRVWEIKGSKGTPQNGWQIDGATGLTGIAQGLTKYYEAFSGRAFGNSIVKGWLEKSIFEFHVSLRKQLAWGDTDGRDSYHTHLGTAISSRLNAQYLEPGDAHFDDFQQVFSSLKSTPRSTLADKIQYVQEHCEKFADLIDKKLKDNRSGDTVAEIVKIVKEAGKDGVGAYGQKAKDFKNAVAKAVKECKCSCSNCNGPKTPEGCAQCTDPKCVVSQIVESSLSTLSTASRQVSEELHSVLLGKGTGSINIADLLDKAKKATDDLHGQLDNATKNSTPPTPEPGTAQAVDTAIGGVKSFVNGSGTGQNDLTNIFTGQVKNELQQKVDQLPGAVSTFNQQAEAQIRDAARTAITEAAKIISEDGHDPDVKKLMTNFHGVYDPIKNGLEKQLQGKVDDHIGEDDPPSPPGGQGGEQKVKLNTDHFDKYIKHVVPDKVSAVGGLKGEQDEGRLPEAIGNIKTEVYDALKMIEPSPTDNGNKIDKNTFTVPFETITTQHDAIKELVENKQGTD
ncbi:Extracellular matrix-binding ebh, putative [Babesia ovata]|uniref:Extracellular matrix-binding ebh, putative n=1 Tax=Babesia ovata TaxID=189622 RepID=A0A2H6KBD0_9APIC|nr:Extracellular matrix-binding ebh, putative [Babesia ovata]GBE60302.1 Extracellular matrix-binding ebh, putative [Babesia ovata]